MSDLSHPRSRRRVDVAAETIAELGPRAASRAVLLPLA
jgi:hypothetical protein